MTDAIGSKILWTLIYLVLCSGTLNILSVLEELIHRRKGRLDPLADFYMTPAEAAEYLEHTKGWR